MLVIGDPMVLYPIAVEDMQFPFMDIVVMGMPDVASIFVPKLALWGEQEFIVAIDTHGIEFMEYVGVIGDMLLADDAIVVGSEYNLLDNIPGLLLGLAHIHNKSFVF